MRFTPYGASDESYQKVCGIPDGFTKVKRSVELLREAGIPLYLAATITKENENDLEQKHHIEPHYKKQHNHLELQINRAYQQFYPLNFEAYAKGLQS